jgi:hypothetical protein
VVYNACIHQINTYHLCVRMLRTIMYVYCALHACITCINHILRYCRTVQLAKLYYLLPYCRIAILPYHAQCANILYTQYICVDAHIYCTQGADLHICIFAYLHICIFACAASLR